MNLVLIQKLTKMTKKPKLFLLKKKITNLMMILVLNSKFDHEGKKQSKLFPLKPKNNKSDDDSSSNLYIDNDGNKTQIISFETKK